jgi:HD superfamily phosphodiesterase
MNLTTIIESVELRYKQILEEFFIQIYDEKVLSSHGIEHHRRVWNNSKELLLLLSGKSLNSLSQLPSKLIIASYLHDIGMLVETGIRHGKHSRDFGIQFLEKNHIPIIEYQDVLEAIEYHDRKDYTESFEVNDLLKILSVADDLDAFGFIGIFRYAEIYLTRGINPQEIGSMVRENAKKRFDNFIKTFGFAGELVAKHKKRFDILNDFFENYNKQVQSYKFGGKYRSGYCGVIDIISDVINGKASLNDIGNTPYGKFSDPAIDWFFKEFISESVNSRK